MSRKGEPVRTFYDGAAYVSSLGLAQALGVSPRALRRWEKDGIIRRPPPIPEGSLANRWYLQSTVEAWKVALAEGGKDALAAMQDQEVPGDVLGDVAEPRRSWPTFARGGRRRAREQVELDADDDGAEDVDLGRWDTGALGRQAPATAVRCRSCGAELVYDTRMMPGAGAGYNQPPLRCERCGALDAPALPPVAGTCLHCGGDDVVWEMRDIEGTRRQAPICATCGLTEVHESPPEPRRETPWASFPHSVAEMHRRPRGLGLGDVVGAVRKPPPPPRPRVATWLPPYERGN